jgi:hypothetical protein
MYGLAIGLEIALAFSTRYKGSSTPLLSFSELLLTPSQDIHWHPKRATRSVTCNSSRWVHRSTHHDRVRILMASYSHSSRHSSRPSSFSYGQNNTNGFVFSKSVITSSSLTSTNIPQPFVTLSNGSSPANRTVTADYNILNRFRVLRTSFLNKDWILFIAAATTIINMLLDPLAGSVFIVRTLPREMDSMSLLEL